MFLPVDTTGFLIEGYRMMGWRVNNLHNVNNVTVLRRFSAAFGATPLLCSRLWLLIGSDNNNQPHLRTARPKHLLWALLFLKQYKCTELNCGSAGVDETTYRKWSWIFVQLLADINVVSTCYVNKYFLNDVITCNNSKYLLYYISDQ